MAQDTTGFIAALKEVWITDTIEDQLYQGNPLLDEIERISPSAEIGRKAVIPIHTARSGAYSAVPRTGSNSLNAADSQELKQAEYVYTRHWHQVELDTAVINDSSSSPKAVAKAVDVEMKGSVSDLRKQLTRQAFGNGDALIAQCTTTSGSTTVKLLASGYGYDAIKRGWLYPGLKVDIGTTTEEAKIAGDREITAVSESATEPTITISGEAVETTSSHYVSIANARSGATSNEMSGLRQLVAASGVVGGINPSEVSVWASAVDSIEQALSLDLLYERQDEVFQRTGEEPDWALTSSKQYREFYKLLQAQVRFNGDGNLGAGKKSGLMLGDTVVQRQPDCPDRLFFFLTKGDLCTVSGEGPVWASQKYNGSNANPVEWKQGTTKVVGAVEYNMQLALKRRNSHTALTNLT